MKKTITIKATMEERWIHHFCSMLKRLERNGEIGHSCAVGIYSDGDGDFRPEFEIDYDYTNIDSAVKDCKIAIYDAG